MDITKLKPSELIRVALKDLRACELDPRYEIDMLVWHDPNLIKGVEVPYPQARPCQVCLAGSVMAQSLGTNPQKLTHPREFEDDTRAALFALEEFRAGHVSTGLACLSIVPDDRLRFNRIIARYKANPARFVNDMYNLAYDLDAAGY